MANQESLEQNNSKFEHLQQMVESAVETMDRWVSFKGEVDQYVVRSGSFLFYTDHKFEAIITDKIEDINDKMNRVKIIDASVVDSNNNAIFTISYVEGQEENAKIWMEQAEIPLLFDFAYELPKTIFKHSHDHPTETDLPEVFSALFTECIAIDTSEKNPPTANIQSLTKPIDKFLDSIDATRDFGMQREEINFFGSLLDEQRLVIAQGRDTVEIDEDTKEPIYDEYYEFYWHDEYSSDNLTVRIYTETQRLVVEGYLENEEILHHTIDMSHVYNDEDIDIQLALFKFMNKKMEKFISA